MTEDSDSISEEERSLFRPFTRESLVQIEQRIAAEHEKQKELERKRAEGEVVIISNWMLSLLTNIYNIIITKTIHKYIYVITIKYYYYYYAYPTYTYSVLFCVSVSLSLFYLQTYQIFNKIPIDNYNLLFVTVTYDSIAVITLFD